MDEILEMAQCLEANVQTLKSMLPASAIILILELQSKELIKKIEELQSKDKQ